MRAVLLCCCAAIIVAVVAAGVSADQCSPAPNCQVCVDTPLCGWCSNNVTLNNGQTGAHCAGFTPGKPFRFKCTGIFSIENCVSGYTCDQDTFACVSAGPGQGVPLAQCQTNCTNNGKVYLCDETTYTCKVVPSGTPGSTSLNVCQQQCVKPDTNTASASPASPNPAPTPTTGPSLWACNYTSGQCIPSVPGQGTSKEVCEQSCTTGKVTYVCNSGTHQCNPLPPSEPNGLPLAQCELLCNPSPAPGPPPGFPTGLYRGLLIDNAYTSGVVYVDVEETIFTMVMMKDGAVQSYLQGTPSNVPPSTVNEHSNILEVTITAPAQYAGQTLNTISDLSGLPGPETTFITMAYAAQLGQPAPQSVTGAMTDPQQHVLALAKCQTPECLFTLPSLSKATADAMRRGGINRLRHLLPHQVGGDAAAAAVLRDHFDDKCSAYGDTCPDCLSQPLCGWCSTNVTYITGETGSQCAGFNGGTNTTPWVCNGIYSTLSCAVGYLCNTSTAQCLVAPPGNGVPLEECEAQCRVTQTQAPPVQQYVCNTTLKQCFQCNQTSCAGGMPLDQCQAACINPKPGPPSHLLGYWRGFYIQAGYKDIEIDLDFGNATVTAYTDDGATKLYDADVTSYGNNAMIFKFTSGKHKGFKRALYYQESQEVPNNIYEAITVAEGTIGGPIPQSFPPAMVSPGMDVLVFYKCSAQPCVFRAP